MYFREVRQSSGLLFREGVSRARLTIDMLEIIKGMLVSAKKEILLASPGTHPISSLQTDAFQLHESQCKVSIGSHSP